MYEGKGLTQQFLNLFDHRPMITHFKMFGFKVPVVGQPPGNEVLKDGLVLEMGSVHRS